jgi:hypothetical protein
MAIDDDVGRKNRRFDFEEATLGKERSQLREQLGAQPQHRERRRRQKVRPIHGILVDKVEAEATDQG